MWPSPGLRRIRKKAVIGCTIYVEFNRGPDKGTGRDTPSLACAGGMHQRGIGLHFLSKAKPRVRGDAPLVAALGIAGDVPSLACGGGMHLRSV